jgi:hypothetical protein
MGKLDLREKIVKQCLSLCSITVFQKPLYFSLLALSSESYMMPTLKEVENDSRYS